MKKTALASVAAAAMLGATLIAATPASAAPADATCLRAGMATLRGAGLVDDVAREGLSVSFAVNELGVTVRPGKDASGLPSMVPLRVLLADHRAGDDSILLYPWCEA